MRGTEACEFPDLHGRIVAIDVETNGLNVYKGNRAFCFSFFTNKGEYGFTRITPSSIEWLNRQVSNTSNEFVGHNMKTEIKFLGVEGVKFPRARTHCTLIQSKLVNSLLPNHDLRSLAIRFADRDPGDKDEIIEWLKANRRRFMLEHGRAPNFSDAPIEIVQRRNLWDVESTIYLYEIFRSRIRETCEALYRTEQQLMFDCVDMEDRGVPIDLTRVKQLRERSLIGVAKLKDQLNKVVGKLTIMKNKTKRVKGEKVKVQIPLEIESFNPGSPVQMEAAFNKVGIELKHRTKPKKDKSGQVRGGGRWSFDEYAMIQYVSPPLQSVIRESGEKGWLFPQFYREVKKAVRVNKLSTSELLPPFVLKFRELSKMVSTYYDNMLQMATDVEVEPSGREVGIIHCSFNQAEAKTGRFSSSEPNLQNMPRLLGPRECFIPRKGRVHWHFDYSQVEMRLFAHFAQDPKMVKAILNDIHRHTASKINRCRPEDVTDEQRKRAKKVNFGPLYGSGADTLAETMTRDGFPTTADQTRSWLSVYHDEFPSVRRTTNNLKVELSRNGYIRNPFGRRYHIPVRFAYKGLNYDCQGTSADLMKRALVDIAYMLRKGGYKSRVILTVHDELVIEMVRSEQRVLVPTIIRLMENHTDFFMPIIVDAEVVIKRWSQKVDPKEVGIDLDEAIKLARSNRLVEGTKTIQWSKRLKKVAGF
jgi:DNA polymerase I-like protein with 3'-5' exonuclease and polymerase domains